MATATKSKVTSYISDQKNRVLVIEGEDYEYNQRGRVIQRFPPTRLEFKDWRCEVESYKGPVKKNEGIAVVNGVLQGMKYDELIPVIEAHRFNGLRFWAVGKNPREKRPTIDELKDQIDGATGTQLAEMLAREEATHNRPKALALIGAAALGDRTGDGGGGGS